MYVYIYIYTYVYVYTFYTYYIYPTNHPDGFSPWTHEAYVDRTQDLRGSDAWQDHPGPQDQAADGERSWAESEDPPGTQGDFMVI